ncbi:MAG: hypothetical protein Q8L09_02375 [Candidatus Moranbacteria bacterium]|nr:hypothetical protein [Candidatus Moranbacteria bacterium]
MSGRKKTSGVAPGLEVKGAAVASAADRKITVPGIAVAEEEKLVVNQGIKDEFDSEEKKAKIEKIKKEYGEEIKEAIKEAYGKLKEKMEWALVAKENAERKRLIESKGINYDDLAKEIDEFSSSIEKIEESMEQIFQDIAAGIADLELAGKKIKYTQFAQNAVYKRCLNPERELSKFLTSYKELRKIEKRRENIGKSGSEAGDAAGEREPAETDIKEELFKKAGIQEARESLALNYDSLSPNEKRIVDVKMKALNKANAALSEIAKLPEEDVEYFLKDWLMPVLNRYRKEKDKIDIKKGELAALNLEFIGFVEEIAREENFSEEGVKQIAKFFEEATEIEDFLAKSK